MMGNVRAKSDKLDDVLRRYSRSGTSISEAYHLRTYITVPGTEHDVALMAAADLGEHAFGLVYYARGWAVRCQRADYDLVSFIHLSCIYFCV